MFGIRRSVFPSNKYLSLTLGRNRKGWKSGHYYKYRNFSGLKEDFLGCGCGNPNVPHKGIEREYFYACANFDIHIPKIFSFHAWMNNRGLYGSYYYIGPYTIGTLHRYAWKDNEDYKKAQCASIHVLNRPYNTKKRNS